MTPQAVIEQARTLKERAERHKWAQRQHRRKAREAMQELEALCERHGITLTVIDTAPRRAQSHERTRRT